MGQRIDRDTFLKRAFERFGDHYDYSAMVYRSYKSPIRIRCKDHPVRWITITPERHLQTTGGCKYCLRKYRNRTLERTFNLNIEARDPVRPPLEKRQVPASPSTL